MMFSVLNTKYAAQDITACVSKKTSQWRRMHIDSASTECTHIIGMDVHEQVASHNTSVSAHADKPTHNAHEAAGGCDTDSHTSEPLKSSESREAPTVVCSYIQVQTFNCNRPRLAPVREPRYENSFVQTKHLNYLKPCAACPDCTMRANRIRGEHIKKVGTILVWDWRKLVRSHTVVDNKIVLNPDSWYARLSAQKELRQHFLDYPDRDELIVMSDLAAEEYAKQHGNIPYVGNNDRPGFVHAGFRFYRGMKARYEMLQCAFKESERIYDVRSIKCVYSKYVDDASYIRYIERRENDSLITEACTAFPRMAYETALYLSACFARAHRDKSATDTIRIDSLSFDGILSGFRNYYGSVRVYFTSFMACENEHTPVGECMSKDQLAAINIGRIDTQTVCVIRPSGYRNIHTSGLCAVDITSMDDFHNIGGDFIFNLFSHYVWTGDITDMWLATESISLEQLKYPKSLVTHIKKAVSYADTSWCRQLLNKETIIIRVSPDARSLTGELCKECVVTDGFAPCFMCSAVVYFSQACLDGLRTYLTQLRDICTHMSLIGVHAQDVFGYKREVRYDNKLEDRLLSESERSSLRHDAKTMWHALKISHDTEARKRGFKSVQAYKDMICDIKDRSYSFLHISATVSNAFYEIVTAGHILLKYDIYFKRDHCDDIRKRYLFSVGTLVFNTDSFADRYLNDLQYKHALIIGQGTQSAYDDLFGQDFDGSKFTKRNKGGGCHLAELIKYAESTDDTMRRKMGHHSRVYNYERVYERKISKETVTDIKTLCIKLHSKYSAVHFFARFHDNSPIRLYAQSKDINIWRVSHRYFYQYIYHKAYMFHVYIFGAFVNKLDSFGERYTAHMHHTTRVVPHMCAHSDNHVTLNQCASCAENVVAVEHDSAVGAYINAHIAELMPIIVSFYRLRSFCGVETCTMDERLHPNLLHVKACDSAVEFLYHEDADVLNRVAAQIHGDNIDRQTVEEILKDDRFCSILMEADNTVYGMSCASAAALKNDIDFNYRGLSNITHDGRAIRISTMRHDDAQFIAKLRQRHASDFVKFRNDAIAKYALKLRLQEQDTHKFSLLTSEPAQTLYTQTQSTPSTQDNIQSDTQSDEYSEENDSDSDRDNAKIMIYAPAISARTVSTQTHDNDDTHDTACSDNSDNPEDDHTFMLYISAVDAPEISTQTISTQTQNNIPNNTHDNPEDLQDQQ